MATLTPRATLRDVAQRAGVHQSTVSLALRNDPRIPLATRQRIQAVAGALDYRVDPLVAALMRTRRRRLASDPVTIAYVTSHPTRFGWRPEHHARPDFFPGARAEAERRGFKLEHFWSREPGVGPRRLAEILRNRGIRGVVFGRLPPGLTSLEFEYERFSCVALGLTLTSAALPRVAEDHFDTVAQAMARCAARGYRRVGLVFSDADDSPAVGERWLGAFCAQQRQFPAGDRLAPFHEREPDARTFARWFESQQPDVLIATHAAPVAEWLKALGVTVPGDVGLVDLDPASQEDFAGVRNDPARIGALAIELLVGLLQRNATGTPSGRREQVLLPGSWCDGRTLPLRGQPMAARIARSA